MHSNKIYVNRFDSRSRSKHVLEATWKIFRTNLFCLISCAVADNVSHAERVEFMQPREIIAMLNRCWTSLWVRQQRFRTVSDSLSLILMFIETLWKICAQTDSWLILTHSQTPVKKAKITHLFTLTFPRLILSSLRVSWDYSRFKSSSVWHIVCATRRPFWR